MKRTTLTILALTAIALLLNATAQSPVGRRVIWPAEPEDILKLSKAFASGTTPYPLSPGEQLDLYTVPPDKWLVLQGLRLNEQVSAFVTETAYQVGEISIRDFIWNHFLRQSPDGLACRPGARLYIRNETQAPQDVDPVGVYGYLVDTAAGLVTRAPWPPAPEHQLAMRTHYPNGGLQLAPGEEEVALVVPPDRWLVLQSLVVGSDGSVRMIATRTAGTTGELDLTMSPLLPISQSAGGPDGVSCKPGARIVMRNTGSNPATVEYFGLRGYFAFPGQ